MLGRVFQLQKPIVNGTGMLTIGGTMWRVAGPDCAAGDQVLVVHVEGTLLVVNPIAR
jgi:membrane protein implicated in regulation of membrane protease activity